MVVVIREDPCGCSSSSSAVVFDTCTDFDTGMRTAPVWLKSIEAKAGQLLAEPGVFRAT
jgi:hypothetical protein